MTRVYSVASAPDTIDATLQFVSERNGVYFPSADVMYSNPYAALSKDLSSAVLLGAATVDGAPCEHLAFIAPGVNWEIWIETGKRALPRRLVVTYTEAQNFLRFLVEFSDWNLKPKLAPSQFVFKQPSNAA